MPTYELPKDKRLDYLLTVQKNILPKFLEILAGVSDQSVKALEKNQNGPSEYNDSLCPLPNMTFEYGDKQYFIRRDAHAVYFDNFEKAIEIVENEGDDESCVAGLELYHIPYYRDNKELSDPSYIYPNVEITYLTLCDFGGDGCVCERSMPDFLNLPSDTTPALVESLFQVRKPGDKPDAGTLFGYFVFSMHANVAERLREILPGDMREFLENMKSYHAVYHDEENDELDGCEAYLLYNVPLSDYDHDFESENYNDPDELMGARLAAFLTEHESDLSDSGNFVVYMSPQPGILKINGDEEPLFSTPWKIVDYCCWDANAEANLMWGDGLYYTDDPFHLQIQRFINIKPEVLENVKYNEIKREDLPVDSQDESLNKNLPSSRGDSFKKPEKIAGKHQEAADSPHASSGGDPTLGGFKNFLIEQGYKEYTRSGKPSTVYDYIKRIERVCENEGMDWSGLEENIDRIVTEYDKDGAKAELGAASHSAVINALKGFQRFVKDIDHGEELTEEKAENAGSDTITDLPKGLMIDPKKAIQDDYIACCICGEKRQAITNKHLEQHGLNMEEYKKQCGYTQDQPLMALNMLKQSRQIMDESIKSSE